MKKELRGVNRFFKNKEGVNRLFVKNKEGQANIIVMVLIVLIAIVAITIVFGVVKNIVSEKSKDIESGYQSYLNALQGDSDGDGYTDDEEIAAGTDPNNPNDHPIRNNEDFVAYYKFNYGNTVDYSGNKNHITLYDGVSYVLGIDEGAVSFDGNDYMEVNNVSGFENIDDLGSSLTISSWIKKPSQNWMWDTIVSTDSFKFQIDNKKRIHWAWTDGDDSADYYSRGKINLDEWTHVAVVVAGNLEVVDFYINGIQTNSERINYILGEGRLTREINNLRIGRDGISGTGLQDYFKGEIDELRIYDKALSPPEVLQVYNEYKPGINRITRQITLLDPNIYSVNLHMEINESSGINTLGITEYFPEGWYVYDISHDGVERIDRIEWIANEFTELPVEDTQISYTVFKNSSNKVFNGNWFSVNPEINGDIIGDLK